MKRRDLIRHLEEHGCQLLREGGNHTIYVNRAAKKTSSVHRHNEINNDLAKKICKDLSGAATRRLTNVAAQPRAGCTVPRFA